MDQVFDGKITEKAVEEICQFSTIVSVGEKRSGTLPSLVAKHPISEFRKGSSLRFGLYADFPETVGDAFLALVEDKKFLIYLGELKIVDFQDRAFWIEDEADQSLIWLSKIDEVKVGGRLLPNRAVRAVGTC